MNRKKLLKEINEFASKCWGKVNTHYGYYTYSFSRYRWKFGFSNEKMEELCDAYVDGDIGAPEMMFFFKVVTLLNFSKKFEEAALVRLTEERMQGFCNRNTYKQYKDKLIEHKLLIATSNRNWFIVNPKYLNKFYKTRVNMTSEQFKEFKDKRIKRDDKEDD